MKYACSARVKDIEKKLYARRTVSYSEYIYYTRYATTITRKMRTILDNLKETYGW